MNVGTRLLDRFKEGYLRLSSSGTILESNTAATRLLQGKCGRSAVTGSTVIGAAIAQVCPPLASVVEEAREGWETSRRIEGVAVGIRVFVENDQIELFLSPEQDREELPLDFLDGLGDAVYVHPVGGRFLQVNRHACERLGYSREELLGMGPTDLIAPEDVASYKERQRRIAETGHLIFEVEHITKDGRVMPTEVVTALVPFRGSQVVVALARDISQRKKLENRVRQSQRMEAIGQLAGGVAHDFNNLLTVILGNAELMKATTADRGTDSHLNEVIRASERAASLTRQLLAFSRRQVLSPQNVDINRLVSGTERMLSRLIGENIEVIPRYSEEPIPTRVDPGQIEQVVLNLAVNARDAMPRGGRLLIRTERVELDEDYCRNHPPTTPGEYALLEFADTGLGMSEEVRERIFEPFFTTKADGRGTGLGLSTVYGIIKQSGGYIWVESRPGEGSTFSVYLPLAQTASAAGGGKNTAPGESPGGHETILVVEDEDSLRHLAVEILRRRGYTVLEAPDPHSALNLVKGAGGSQRRFDLLLTDVVLPGMSGDALARALGTENVGFPVLYMSGYGETALQPQGRSFFIQKPFSAAALSRRVREALESAATGPTSRRPSQEQTGNPKAG